MRTLRPQPGSRQADADRGAFPGDERKPGSLLGIYLRGMAMGAADIVPGVSGGTMALILGIYSRLIFALRSLARPRVLRPLFAGRLRRAFGEADGLFLLALVAGIATSVLLLSHVLSSLLENRPVQVHAFFFGLIAASVVLVARRIRSFTASRLALLALGAISAFLVVGLTPADTPDAPWFLFLSGALAISALLLPGISGAFILVLLGKYEYVLDAVSNGDLARLGVVAAGAAVGILSFTQLLGWLFRRYHDTTLAILAGIMLGSLRKVWPWQVESGALTTNVLPVMGSGSDWLGLAGAILLALTGAAVVAGLDRLTSDE